MASDFGASIKGRLLILLVVGRFTSNDEGFVSAAAGEENGHFETDPLSYILGEADLGYSSGSAASEYRDGRPILKVVHNRNPQQLNRLEMLRRDEARVEWLQSKLTPAHHNDLTASSDVMIPTTSGLNLGTGNYLVSLGLGTPAKEFQLEMDTGSPLTWTQCQPCQTCYNQTDPIFNSSASSTYSNILCPSSNCSYLYQNNPPPCTSNGACSYYIGYGDNSNTSGPHAVETLTLTSSVNLPNYIFGCGQDNQGLFGSSDGLFGLSNDGVFSMVTQGASQFGEYFSYCLPSSTASTGFLVLGNTSEGAPNSTGLGFTPIITLPNHKQFYGINITGISVGGVPLSASSSEILMNSSSIIDSGTVITRFPPDVYADLRLIFRQQMANYTMAQGDTLLDTCYDFSNFSDFNDIAYPKIVISLIEGVNVELDFNGIFFVYTPSQVCLAFAIPLSNSNLVIYGNVQQRTFEIAYDVTNKQLGFWANACS